MKIMVYNLDTLEYVKIADTRDIRIILDNGDKFDISQRSYDTSALNISTVNYALGIFPIASNVIELKKVM